MINTFLLIIILFRDDVTGKRYPAVFSLINNKNKNGYLYLFNKIKEIIKLQNEKKIELISYSTDFEESLIQALKEVFPDKRGVGCYFHYI